MQSTALWLLKAQPVRHSQYLYKSEIGNNLHYVKFTPPYG